MEMMRKEMLLSPPPPRPLSPVIYPIESSPNTVSDHRSSYNPSLLIIAGIIAAAVIAAASIHLLFRVLSRSRSSSDPFLPHLSSSTSSSSSSSSNQEEDPKVVIDSLPLFSLASSNAKPTSSLDCAVCLSPFSLTDQLRLLPLCRHAFHSQCIDTWLRSNLSCPLCRSPLGPVPSPPDPLPSDPARSESFRVEIGSVSRRISTSADPNTAASSTYSIGSSFEYVVDEEVDAVLSRVRRRPTEYKFDLAPPPPGAEVAEVAGASHRSWLKDYVDRLASSASSSFSSWRFSQRGSNRIDSNGGGDGNVTGGGEGWDLERNLHLHLEEEDGGFSAFYRWLVGV